MISVEGMMKMRIFFRTREHDYRIGRVGVN
jgi:hypothetical protein